MESSAGFCASRNRQVGGICTTSRAGCWRAISLGARRRGEGRRRGANHDHRSDAPLPASGRRGGFRTARAILGRRCGPAGVSSGCRDPLCGFPPCPTHRNPAGIEGESVLVGGSRSWPAGCRRAFRFRSVARQDRGLRRFAASPAGRFSPGVRTQRSGCQGAAIRILAPCEPVYCSGGESCPVLAWAGRPLERSRPEADTAWAGGLGREYTGCRWSDRAGLESERLLPSRGAGRILEDGAPGSDGNGSGAAEKDILSCFEEERCT